jgi:hypothetical protein
MSRTILDPKYANDLNGLFDGTGTSIVQELVIANPTLTGNIVLTCLDNGFLQLNGGINAEADITTTGNVNGAYSDFGQSSANQFNVVGTTATPATVYLNSAPSQTITDANSLNLTYTDPTTGDPVDCEINAAYGQFGQCSTNQVNVLSAATVNLNSGPATILGASVNELSLSYVDPGTGVSVDCAINTAYGQFGQVSSGLYRGNGIGKLVESVAIPSLTSTSTFPFTATIPNFVGSATTAYCASYSPSGGGAPYGIGIQFTSTNNVNTIVTLNITNPSSTTLGAATVTLSIIALN